MRCKMKSLWLQEVSFRAGALPVCKTFWRSAITWFCISQPNTAVQNCIGQLVNHVPV